MIVSSERTAPLGIHVTPETKETLKQEAARRNMSMSALAAKLLVDGLTYSLGEHVEERSNKRVVDKETGISIRLVDSLKFSGDTFKKVMEGMPLELLPGIPGHCHSIGADGQPTCGCKFKPVYKDVPLPLETE